MSETASAAPAVPAASPAPASTPSAQSADLNASSGANEITEGIGEETEEIATEEEKKEVANLKKKYQLKVNNKVKDLELDLGNDQEVQRYLQKAMAADEKFQEASNLRKQVEQLIQELKTNPLAILRHEALGIDVKALAEQVMNEQLQDLNKTPEQKKMEEMEQKLKNYEEEKKKLEDEKRLSEMTKIQEQAFQELDDQISSALGKSELPKSPYVVKRIADAMITAHEMGYKDVTVDQIMPFVESQMTDEIQRMFDESPEQVREKIMEKFVGKKNLDNYRKSRITKAKGKPVETAKSVKDAGASKEAKKEEAKLRFKDVFGGF